ncbi:hypothetical protein B7486_57510, partial [cyanobacterium TDX16]
MAERRSLQPRRGLVAATVLVAVAAALPVVVAGSSEAQVPSTTTTLPTPDTTTPDSTTPETTTPDTTSTTPTTSPVAPDGTVSGGTAPDAAAAPGPPPAAAEAPATTFAGQPSTVLTRDGGWSWFEGPRTILDECELQLSSVAIGQTADGSARRGDVDVVTLDLATGTRRVDTLAEGMEPDDHDSAAVFELPSGKVVALYSRHRADNRIRRAFRAPGVRHWTDLPIVFDPRPVTYSNLAFLADEGSSGVLYDFYRASVDPSVLRSTDHGATWQAVGPLLRNGGHRPYVRYADDGLGRIEVATTNGHPREAVAGSSVYHGFVQGGRLHTSDGTDVGPLGSGPHPSDLSLVHQGDAEQRAW